MTLLFQWVSYIKNKRAIKSNIYLPLSFTRFRGVSTKHLQGYLDRFLFQKALSYAKEVLDRPGAELSSLLRTRSVILCREILTKAMPISLHEAYAKWHYGIFA